MGGCACAPDLCSPADGGRFVTCEDPESICQDLDYVRSRSLGGAMMWDLSSDVRDAGSADSLVHVEFQIHHLIGQDWRRAPSTSVGTHGQGGSLLHPQEGPRHCGSATECLAQFVRTAKVFRASWEAWGHRASPSPWTTVVRASRHGPKRRAKTMA